MDRVSTKVYVCVYMGVCWGGGGGGGRVNPYTVLGGRTIVTLREETRVTKGGGLLLYRWSPQSLSIYNSLLLYAYYSLNCDQSDLGKLEGSHLFFPFKLPGEICWRHLHGSTHSTRDFTEKSLRIHPSLLIRTN